MPLVAMKDMIQHATRNGYTLGGFHVYNLESLSAVIAAAEECRAPVMLGVSRNLTTASDLEILLAAAEHAAQRARVPIAIHAEQGSDVSSAIEAIRWGCNGVAADGSRLDLPANIELTRASVEMASKCGIPVEGVAGSIDTERRDTGRSGRVPVESVSVDVARAFVERTGIDFLAVLTGNDSTSQSRGKPDMQRLGRIAAAISTPIIVHGGASLSDDQLRRLIAIGVAKINFSLPEGSSSRGRGGHSREAGSKQSVREVMQAFVEDRLRTLGSAGRAAEVLLHCQAWNPVEHVIVFNVDTNLNLDVQQVLAHGRKVLGEIPGVRYVYTGQALKDDAAYRYCWLVRFAHPDVVESYRDHPVHKKFADELFRPIAPARISIDYSVTASIEPELIPEGIVRQQVESPVSTGATVTRLVKTRLA